MGRARETPLEAAREILAHDASVVQEANVLSHHRADETLDMPAVMWPGECQVQGGQCHSRGSRAQVLRREFRTIVDE